MREYFQLNSKEKKQEWLMLTFAILSFVIIAKGIYNQYYKIDQDYILVPLYALICSGFFLIYGINAFTKGNLTAKWTPRYIFQIVCFLTKTIGSITQEKARNFSIKLLGSLGLIISAGLFVIAIISLTMLN